MDGDVRLLPYEGKRGLGIIVISSHDRKGVSCKRMNGGGKGKSEKLPLKLESIWIRKLLHYKDI